jgi:hypothetical protein
LVPADIVGLSDQDLVQVEDLQLLLVDALACILVQVLRAVQGGLRLLLLLNLFLFLGLSEKGLIGDLNVITFGVFRLLMVNDLAMALKSLHLLQVLRLVLRDPAAAPKRHRTIIVAPRYIKVLLVSCELGALQIVQVLPELLPCITILWAFLDLLDLWRNFGGANRSPHLAQRMDPLLDRDGLRGTDLLARVLSLPLLLHVLPHVEDVAEDDPLMELKVSILIPRG